MYKISIQYTNPFKRYRTETKSVMGRTDGTDVRTDRGDTICPPPTPPLKMVGWGGGGGHKKCQPNGPNFGGSECGNLEITFGTLRPL